MVSQYPEWYRVEKEAAIVINRITNYNDLTYYLNNSNPFIRRSAILRMNSLQPKEGMVFLEELINNPTENSANKELAALTLKKISLKWNTDIFATNPIITKYSGKESLADIYGITIIEPQTTLSFSFSNSFLSKDLDIDEDYLYRNQETNFDDAFSLQEWYKVWKLDFNEQIWLFIKNSPLYLWKSAKKLADIIGSLLFNKLGKPLINLVLQQYHHNKERINPLNILKCILFNIFYIILCPIRLFRKRKVLTIGAGLAFYFFLTYTAAGKAVTSEYLQIDLLPLQNQTFLTTKQFAASFWLEISSVTGVWFKKLQATGVWETIEEYIKLAISLKEGH